MCVAETRKRDDETRTSRQDPRLFSSCDVISHATSLWDVQDDDDAHVYLWLYYQGAKCVVLYITLDLASHYLAT